jgi:hypothetical protein
VETARVNRVLDKHIKFASATMIGDAYMEAIKIGRELEIELTALEALEKRVRAMFAFSGWEDGVDDDARESVEQVMRCLDDLEAVRRLFNLKREDAEIAEIPSEKP